MKFEIVEFDNDYRALVSIKDMEFDSIREAHAWCDEHTWDGISYYVSSRDL